MKKTLAWLMAVLVTVGNLWGCSSNNGKASQATTATLESSSSESETAALSENLSEGEEKEWFGTENGETVTLHFWGGVQPEYGYDEMVRNFNEEYKDKGIQVEYHRYVSDSTGNLQLETYLMGGSEVDVFIGYGVAYMKKRVESNLLYNMADKLKEYQFDLGEELGKETVKAYTFEDGGIYGFPTKYENQRWLMVNVDMFEKAGIPVPYDGWNYDEFLTAIEKLTYGEGQDKVYGMFWAMKQGFRMHKSLFGSPLGKYIVYKNDQGTEVNYDDPVYGEGLEVLKKSMDQGWAFSIEDEYSENLTVANTFLEGKCAVSMNISQMRLVMDQETYPHDFVTALVPGPVAMEYDTDEYRYHSNNLGTGDQICIAANTPYPDAAFEFVMWYTKKGMVSLAKGGRFPLWKGFDQDSCVAELMNNANGTIDEQSLRNYVSIDKSKGITELTLYASAEIETVYKEEEEAMCYGRQSVEEALENICIRSNKLIADEIAAGK
ncbi:MAG: extracellular solute-binding protein [Hungatella sp.]|nr:extracellular solute-binding protein [Hungatella sp.]